MSGTAGNHASVRAMIREDLETVLSWRNHPSVRLFMYNQHEISQDEHQCWFERSQNNNGTHLLIFEIDNKPLGFINFTREYGGSVADWGFYTSPTAPKGTGRQLGRTALTYAFGLLKLHKVCGRVLAYNTRSIKFHQNLGFKLEGTLRKHHFDGQAYHDIACFGLLASEWRPET